MCSFTYSFITILPRMENFNWKLLITLFLNVSRRESFDNQRRLNAIENPSFLDSEPSKSGSLVPSTGEGFLLNR